jgi:uncharacterized protein YfaS (alpha-2-macroglobulin family)
LSVWEPTLTRGDEVSFPVAVYNYLDTAQTVRVEMLAADWFTPLGATGIDIELGPGQVTGVRFPVRVDKVGRQDPHAYKTSNVLSAYEITDKQLMLYLSALPASGSQTFKYRLQATMPVTASDGGAEIYLNYQPKQRSAAAAVTLQVVETPATI